MFTPTASLAAKDEEEEPAPAVKKKAVKAKPTWDQVMAKHAKKQPKAYQLGEYFKEMEVLSHPKFGVGFVTENIGDDKIEVTFKDDKRVLVHNRKGLTLPFMRPVAQPKGKKGKARCACRGPGPGPCVRERQRQEGSRQGSASGRQGTAGQGAGQAAEAGGQARPEEAGRQAEGGCPRGLEEARQDRRQEGQEAPLASRGRAATRSSQPPAPPTHLPPPRRGPAPRRGRRACARRAAAAACAPRPACPRGAPERR